MRIRGSRVRIAIIPIMLVGHGANVLRPREWAIRSTSSPKALHASWKCATKAVRSSQALYALVLYVPSSWTSQHPISSARAQ